MVSNYIILEQILYHASAGALGLATATNYSHGRPGLAIATAGLGIVIEAYAFYRGRNSLPPSSMNVTDNATDISSRLE